MQPPLSVAFVALFCIPKVELLGRRYLVVRTEPTKEDLQQGKR